jgi:hypothetical protein
MDEQLPLDGRDALERFRARADELMREDLGAELKDHAYEQVIVLITLMGAVFGVRSAEMRGDERASTSVGRIGLARQLAYAWSPRVVVDGCLVGGRGLRPHAIVSGLRRAVEICQDFPTEGLLAELILGGDARNYPGGMLKGQERPARPLASDGAIQGAALAEEFALDSERRCLDPDRATPDAVAVERLAKCRELLGPGWGVPPAPPSNEAEQERRERLRAAADDDDGCPV